MLLQALTSAIDPMNPDLLPAQFTFSTFSVWTIDLLKRADWFPFLSKETDRLNTVAAIIAAAVTAAGIHFVMEAEVVQGAYTIHITGLTAAGLWHFGKGFAAAIAMQQTILKIYQVTNILREISSKGGTAVVITANEK